MSSRYRNDHYYDNSYANGSSASGSSSRRRTYDYVKINPLLKKSAKAKPKTMGYSTALGRRKPKGEWKEKKKPREEQEDIAALKNRKDAFDAEAIEAELTTFKKGTFVFDEEAEKPKKKASEKEKESKLNGDSKHSKFLLKRTSNKHPPPEPVFNEFYAYDRYSPKPKVRNGRRPKTPKSLSKDEVKAQPEEKERSAESTPREQRPRRKKKSRSRNSEKSRARVQTIVTVGPTRMQYGGYVRNTLPDYFYGPGYVQPSYFNGYQAPYPYGYGQSQRRQMSTGPAVPGYGSYTDPANAMEYYYGNTMDDGAWYPYPADVVALPAPDPYSTPKTNKRSSGSKSTSVNVDLTSPSKDVSNGDTPMSPGRRVNKIQKQLEYYFSIKNMNEDKFLREVMDESGWVTIDTILQFKRMKALGATKELVTEAAFHSTAIEIDPKNTERIRMDKMWKQYVGKRREKELSKKRSSRAKAREKERQRQKELDNADLNDETIEAIVAAIERKQERRKRRREERERQKEKARKAEQEENATKNEQDEDDDDEVRDDESGNQKEETKDDIQDGEEIIKKLIEKDQQQGDDDLGDPDGNDMVNID